MCICPASSPVRYAVRNSVASDQWNTRTNGSQTLIVAGGVTPPAPIVLSTVLIAGPSELAGDLAVGRIDEQFDPVAVLVERIQLAAGVFQLRLLHLVAERFDLALQGLKREPLILRSGGTRLAEGARLRRTRNAEQRQGGRENRDLHQGRHPEYAGG